MTPTQATPTPVTPVLLSTATPLPVTPTLAFTATPSPTPMTGVVAGPGTYDDNSTALIQVQGTWEPIESANGYGGRYLYSADPNAELSVQFLGSGVAVQYVGYRNFGIFELLIDGVLYQEVDAYAAGGTFGLSVFIQGLSRSVVHTLTIRNTGRANPASTGAVLAVDAITVLE
ncbi:MAG: hypothetical protein HC915_14570 [Anaerolineae bacterium]|nr:hypothetical protein [Anaerolineae bacterium]